MAKLALRSRFLEAFFEDMLPTAYVDAHTMKFYFHELFLVVPFFVNQETSEKILMEWLLLREPVVLQAGWLAAFCFVSAS
jgi:hypothetical protein